MRARLDMTRGTSSQDSPSEPLKREQRANCCMCGCAQLMLNACGHAPDEDAANALLAEVRAPPRHHTRYDAWHTHTRDDEDAANALCSQRCARHRDIACVSRARARKRTARKRKWCTRREAECPASGSATAHARRTTRGDARATKACHRSSPIVAIVTARTATTTTTSILIDCCSRSWHSHGTVV